MMIEIFDGLNGMNLRVVLVESSPRDQLLQ